MPQRNIIPLTPPVIRRQSRDYIGPPALRRRQEPYNVYQRSSARPSTSQTLESTTEPSKKMDEATVELMKHLKKQESYLAHSLHRAREIHLESSHANPCAILKTAFHGLQQRFFNDVMGDNVAVGLVHLGPEISGQTHAKHHINNEKVLIRLNADLIMPLFTQRNKMQSRDQLYATLLHHMIHAYFLVRCGSPDPTRDADGRLLHENHFGVIMYKIKEISAKYGRPLPIDFGHSLPTPPAWQNRNQHVQSTLLARRLPNDDRHHCTECTSMLDPLEEQAVKKWYQNKCYSSVHPEIYEFNGDGKLKSTPQHLLRDKKSDWFELYWCNKILKIDKSSIKALSSPFARGFTDQNRRINVPKVPEHTVRALWDFLNSKAYGPNLIVTKNGTRGPALIQGLDPKWTTYIENEVRLHQLATKIQLDELRRRSFSRLMEMHITFEDPIPVFARIYNVEEGGGGDVHEELRKWAIAFMERYSDTLLPDQTPINFSNWRYLKEHAGFQYCLENGGEALATDFRKAGDNLAKLTMGISKEDEVLLRAAQFPGNSLVAAALQDGRAHGHLQPSGMPPPLQSHGTAASPHVQHHVHRVPVQLPIPVPRADHLDFDIWRERSRSRSLSPVESVFGLFSPSPSPPRTHRFEEFHFIGL